MANLKMSQKIIWWDKFLVVASIGIENERQFLFTTKSQIFRTSYLNDNQQA